MSFDPIESAKLGTKQDKQQKREREPLPPLKTKAEVVKPPLPEPAPIAPLLNKYRVKADHRVSVNGAITWVSKGQIIDPAGHGEDHVLKLLEQGVELEEIA